MAISPPNFTRVFQDDIGLNGIGFLSRIPFLFFPSFFLMYYDYSLVNIFCNGF